MGIEKRANASPDFEIGHFLIIFLQKRLFSYFRVVEMQFCHFWPPANIFLTHPWKTTTDPSLEKIQVQHPCLGVHAHVSKY